MAKTFQKPKLILVLILLISSFLRLWKITDVPVSLFGDELDVGYHAYSILKTGRDYSGNFMPLHFQSLAEWRTPLYLYSSVPTVALFGITPLGVRLPAAIFGILGVYGLYLLVKKLTETEALALLSAFVLAISPWHIQYSRAAFEVTELLAFLLFGLYFFFISLKSDRHLWISVFLFVLMPWVYSTAKLFSPLLILFLFLVWRKEIFRFSKNELLKAAFAGMVIGLPLVYSVFWGTGAQRAGYLSVFSDPAIEPEVGTARVHDALMRGELVLNYETKFWDRFFHNKVTFWTKSITTNFTQTYSTDFLFNDGDPNLRHSIKGMGQFYKVEFVALALGIALFFTSKIKKGAKYLIVFWLVFGALPSAITRDGGNHATRLILILPPLTLLVAYGIYKTARLMKQNIRFLFLGSYFFILALSFVFYQHSYWIHNPWDSERWWHAGFKEAIQAIKEVDKDYDTVIISMAGEPAWIFFAGYYHFPPKDWQENFPIGNDVELNGFGKVSHIGKFHFGTFNAKGKSLYDLHNYIGEQTLYLAVAKEIGANLIAEPERTPSKLKLVKAIPYPSGEPAFYLFERSEK